MCVQLSLPLLLKTSRQVRDAQVPFEHYRICKMYVQHDRFVHVLQVGL